MPIIFFYFGWLPLATVSLIPYFLSYRLATIFWFYFLGCNLEFFFNFILLATLIRDYIFMGNPLFSFNFMKPLIVKSLANCMSDTRIWLHVALNLLDLASLMTLRQIRHY